MKLEEINRKMEKLNRVKLKLVEKNSKIPLSSYDCEPIKWDQSFLEVFSKDELKEYWEAIQFNIKKLNWRKEDLLIRSVEDNYLGV